MHGLIHVTVMTTNGRTSCFLCVYSGENGYVLIDMSEFYIFLSNLKNIMLGMCQNRKTVENKPDCV